MPVSYTHLDVYKRQIPENGFLKTGKKRLIDNFSTTKGIKK